MNESHCLSSAWPGSWQLSGRMNESHCLSVHSKQTKISLLWFSSDVFEDKTYSGIWGRKQKLLLVWWVTLTNLVPFVEPSIRCIRVVATEISGKISAQTHGRGEETLLSSGWTLIRSELSSPNLNSSIRAERSFAIRYVNKVIKLLRGNLDICLNYYWKSKMFLDRAFRSCSLHNQIQQKSISVAKNPSTRMHLTCFRAGLKLYVCFPIRALTIRLVFLSGLQLSVRFPIRALVIRLVSYQGFNYTSGFPIRALIIRLVSYQGFNYTSGFPIRALILCQVSYQGFDYLLGFLSGL